MLASSFFPHFRAQYYALSLVSFTITHYNIKNYKSIKFSIRKFGPVFLSRRITAKNASQTQS